MIKTRWYFYIIITLFYEVPIQFLQGMEHIEGREDLTTNLGNKKNTQNNLIHYEKKSLDEEQPVDTKKSQVISANKAPVQSGFKLSMSDIATEKSPDLEIPDHATKFNDSITTWNDDNGNKVELTKNKDGSYQKITSDPSGRKTPQVKYFDRDGNVTVDPNLKLMVDTIKKNDPTAFHSDGDLNKSYYSEDIKTEELKATRDILDSMALKLEKNDKVMSATLFKDIPTEDINQRYDAIKNYDKNTRTIIHKKLNEFNSSKEFNETQKIQFVEDFIEQQLRSFGRDRTSGDNIFNLPEDMQNKLVEKLKTMTDDLFDKKSSMIAIEKSNALAKMSDEIMNTISDKAPTFKTEFDNDGNYITTTSSILSDNSKVIMSSMMDKDGQPVSRLLQVDDLQFITDFKDGWFYGKSRGDVQVKINDADVVKLTSAEGDILSYTWMQHKANQMFATTVKLTGWFGKQAAITAVSSVFAFPLAVKGTAAVCTLVAIKGLSMLPEKSINGYQISGYDSTRPAVWTTVHKLIRSTVGDEGESVISSFVTGGKPMMSGKSDSIFRTSDDDITASVNNTYFNPIVDGISALFNVVSAVPKALFPQTLGDTMFSSHDISVAQPKATNNFTIQPSSKLFNM
jgi:hypothetical protein